MKSKEKKGILILIGVGVLIVLAIWLFTRVGNNDKKEETNNLSQGEFTKVEQDGTISNTSEKLHQDREDSGFSITNISFGEVKGETVLKARVTNVTGQAQESFLGRIVLFDKSGNKIGEIPINISETQQGETIEIEAYITESYANAYDFKLER